MVIGALTCELLVEGSRSLKDKRRVIRSMIDRVRTRHNVSVAEIGDNDIWNRAKIGVVCVSNDSGRVHSVLEAVAHEFDTHPDAVLSRYEIEVL